jgi:ATP-dependent RNA helicase DeaD
MEICEIQLYHLASSIKNTKVNPDIADYLPAINDVLDGVNREELIKKIVSVEFTRFFNYYNRAKDLNTTDTPGSERRSKDNFETSKNGSVRYFINVGEKDNFDWMSLKDFLRDTLDVGKDDIYKVDVKESFSFFNTDAVHKELILQTFSDFKADGRFVNVEVSKNPESGGGRKTKDKGRRKNKEGGRRKKRDGNSFKTGGRRSGKRRSKKRDGFY